MLKLNHSEKLVVFLIGQHREFVVELYQFISGQSAQ